MAVNRSGSTQAYTQLNASAQGATYNQNSPLLETADRISYNGGKRRGEKQSVYAALCPRGRPLKVIAAGISLCLVLTVLNVILAPAHGRLVRQSRSDIETKAEVGHVDSLPVQVPFEVPKGLVFPAIDPALETENSNRHAAPDKYMEGVRQRIEAHVASKAYQKRVEVLRSNGTRGIIINAGGPKLITNLIVTLKVLREVWKSTLPVEVVHQGPAEMDSATIAGLQTHFAPLRVYDIQATQHPVAGLYTVPFPLRSYTGKVFSLLQTRFSEALLLDADSMPLQHPDFFFQHPEYLSHGSLFFPDAWTHAVKDEAYSTFGLDPGTTREKLTAGKSYGNRDTESGQFVIDVARHLDALEYIGWINAYPAKYQAYMWGDKDSFGIGFAAAGKANHFIQVAVPPAGAFKWTQDMLLVKATGARVPGWQLIGFLQHDSWGRPAFLHRTINKYRLDETPSQLQLVSAPMPRKWVEYYLAHENQGPTRGVPWDYVVPDSAFQRLSINPVVERAPAHKTADAQDSRFLLSGPCPAATFLDYWQMREASLPIDRNVELEKVCLPFLGRMLGEECLKEHEEKGWIDNPQLQFLNAEYLESVGTTAPSPIPAMGIGNLKNPQVEGPFIAAVRAAYDAFTWLQAHAEEFPIVKGKV